MKRKRCHSDRTDNLPLGRAKKKHVEDRNSHQYLLKQSWEKCELCDMTFTNRYSLIVHNVTHIIIPLIKQTVYQCSECLVYFTSLKDLTSHKEEEHRKTHIINPALNQEGLFDTYNDYRSKIPDILQSIVEKQAVIKCQDELRELQCTEHENERNDWEPKDTELRKPQLLNTISLCNVKQELATCEVNDLDNVTFPNIKVTQIQGSSTDYTLTHNINNLSESNINHCNESFTLKREISSPDHVPIQSRIIFEDDLFEPEEILPDKKYHPTHDTQNEVVIKNEYGSNNDSLSNGLPNTGTGRDNNLYNGYNPDVEMETYTKSVSYDELTEYRVVDCKHCGRCFSNRYDLIQHETTHLRIRQPRLMLCCLCERYIAGNYKTLRKHIAAKHPDDAQTKHKIRKCRKCHLKYHNYFKHIRYYHQVYDCVGCKRYYDKEQLQKHRCDDAVFGPNTLAMDKYRVIRMCQMCLSFVRNKKNVRYDVIGEHSEVGKRQSCEKCNVKFFEVMLVKRKVTFREGVEAKGKKKCVTNVDRLKKMRRKLKEFNNRNKL